MYFILLWADVHYGIILWVSVCNCWNCGSFSRTLIAWCVMKKGWVWLKYPTTRYKTLWNVVGVLVYQICNQWVVVIILGIDIQSGVNWTESWLMSISIPTVLLAKLISFPRAPFRIIHRALLLPLYKPFRRINHSSCLICGLITLILRVLWTRLGAQTYKAQNNLPCAKS